MAITISQVSNPVGTRIITDTDSDATSEDDVLSGAATVIKVEVDNSLNGTKVYTKLANNAAPTVGTTDPDIQIPVAAGEKATLAPQPGSGIAFGTALSFWTTTEAGTAGTTSPANDVVVKITVA